MDYHATRILWDTIYLTACIVVMVFCFHAPNWYPESGTMYVVFNMLFFFFSGLGGFFAGTILQHIVLKHRQQKN